MADLLTLLELVVGFIIKLLVAPCFGSRLKA